MLWCSPKRQGPPEGAEVLHALPVEITVDDSPRLRDARGMSATACTSRCTWCACPARPCTISWRRSSAAISMSRRWSRRPYAAGLACLSEDEATFGAVVLDLGAGVTGIARFADGRLHQLASLPLGGST